MFVTFLLKKYIFHKYHVLFQILSLENGWQASV